MSSPVLFPLNFEFKGCEFLAYASPGIAFIASIAGFWQSH